MSKVSVIVPVYNTEKYVERAIASLMMQTLDDVEFIIINDGSKDNSLDIIKQVISRYPERLQQVHLISRENRGVAATRAQGVELAIGNYIIHLDSDDWAEPNWLEAMYTRAIEEDADVVVCNYTVHYKRKAAPFKQVVLSTGPACVGALLTGKLASTNWDKLTRRAIYKDNNINFVDGYNMGEDFLVTLCLFCNANKITSVEESLYNYNKMNESSLTKSFSEKDLNDVIEITKFAENYLSEKEMLHDFKHELLVRKLGVKTLFLCHANNKTALLKKAITLYPEHNESILISGTKILKLAYCLDKLRLTFLLNPVSAFYRLYLWLRY